MLSTGNPQLCMKAACRIKATVAVNKGPQSSYVHFIVRFIECTLLPRDVITLSHSFPHFTDHQDNCIEPLIQIYIMMGVYITERGGVGEV